jgi:hypothetical protein
VSALLIRLKSPQGSQALWQLRTPAAGAAATALALWFSMRSPGASVTTPLIVALGVGTSAWMLTSRRPEVTLAVLMVYLGVADGFLKLRTGSGLATLGRDLLFYSIVIGMLVRAIVRRQPLRLPPLSGWVVAFVAVVLAQLLNPANGSWSHSLASLRPHLEWVPLFFLGYMTMTSARRLRGFLLLLLGIAAINGLVSLVQFNLTPDQFASWGPGYRARIFGLADVTQRVYYVTGTDVSRVRVFGLGSDQGFGGGLAMIALPGALALIGLARRHTARLVPLLLLTAGAVLAIVTSQSRESVLASVLVVLAFGALTAAPKKLVPTLIGITLSGIVTVAIVAALVSHAQVGAFQRYSSIAPGKVISTTYQYRRDTFAIFPKYVTSFPLGAGLGSVGPAGGVSLARTTRAPSLQSDSKNLNAESEFNFLLIELGIPGLLVLLGFKLRLLLLSTHVRRLPDYESRLLLAAVAASLFGLFGTWITGVATATSPAAPYLWFSAGILAYWLIGREHGVERRPNEARGQSLQR